MMPPALKITSPAAIRRVSPATLANTPRHSPPAISSFVTTACVSSVRLGRRSAGCR